MAKKTKSEICCPSITEYKPCLYLDLQDADVGQVKGLSIGEKVELRVTGVVKGLSQRSRQDYDDPKKTVKTGSIDLEGYRVEVLEDEEKSNVYTDMANEEEES
jgi:hypothetical protein